MEKAVPFKVGDIVTTSFGISKKISSSTDYRTSFDIEVAEDKYEILEVRPPTERWGSTWYKIRATDGQEGWAHDLYVYRELTSLELEFQATLESVTPKIDKKLKAALKLIGEAQDLAEKAGIPFQSPCSPLSQSYYPRNDKFKSLPREFLSLTGEWDMDHFHYGDWEHSAVC